jgi:hypothetical protein
LLYEGRKEDILELNFGKFRLATFGQSFHWTERDRVAEAVFEILDPAGALTLIGHPHTERLQPAGQEYWPIPHDAIRALIGRYLGTRRCAGQGYFSGCADSFSALYFVEPQFELVRLKKCLSPLL